MTITPAGTMSLSLQYLINSIAASSTFQALVGAANATEAKAFVFLGYADDENEEQQPPRAIVRHLAGEAGNDAGTTSWNRMGPFRLLLEFPTPEAQADDRTQAYFYATNVLGAIVEEMQTLAINDPGSGPYLAFQGIRLVSFGQWDPDQNSGRTDWSGEFEITWEGM